MAQQSVCLATVDVSPSWDSVAFTAGQFRLEAKASRPQYQMSELRIWVNGKAVSLPKAEFEQIANPKLEKITVTQITPLQRFDGPSEAYIEIPFLVKDPTDGPLKEGGTWVFYLEGSKFTHKELQPHQDGA